METGGHQQLRVYQLAHLLSVKIHAMTLTLPKFEMYEEGSQIRRSSKRVAASIVEGHALRKYKAEYVNYLFCAYGSAEETLEHLYLLFETHSLMEDSVYLSLRAESLLLNQQLFRYLQGVQQYHEVPDSLREESAEYIVENVTE